MRRRPFARANSCGFACAPDASARARKAARAGTIATDAKIQLLFYSGSFAGSFFSPMLELSSKIARAELSWATRLRSGLGKTRSRLSGLFSDRSVDPALFEEIETALLASDAGAEATRFLLPALHERASQGATARQEQTSHRQGRTRRASRGMARARRQHGPERPQTGRGLRRRARPHGTDSHQARRHCKGRYRMRHRAGAIAASAAAQIRGRRRRD